MRYSKGDGEEQIGAKYVGQWKDGEPNGQVSAIKKYINQIFTYKTK